MDTTNTGRGLKQLPTGQAEIAAYIYNLLQGGQTSQAATAIAQAAAQGGTGANAIASAIATASSQVHLPRLRPVTDLLPCSRSYHTDIWKCAHEL